MNYKPLLVTLIVNTDLDVYVEDEAKLNYAIKFAKQSISNRAGCDVDDIPDMYSMNVIEGAKWYLARIGTEGELKNTENGITREFANMPSWLKSVTPAVSVVKRRARA